MSLFISLFFPMILNKYPSYTRWVCQGKKKATKLYKNESLPPFSETPTTNHNTKEYLEIHYKNLASLLGYYKWHWVRNEPGLGMTLVAQTPT
jgi:hypothetical protein